MRVKSKVYLASGFLCIALGVAGIPLPLLPTTPFLLLAAFCFARGSERWHRWLLTHPTLSPYILAFRDKRGLTRGQKLRIAGVVTLTLLVTGAFAPFWQARALAGVIWTTTMLFLYFGPSAQRSTPKT
ncbi:MAG TPA: YbaN family protein [Blastocatellia bacterium]|nr:YbaN family protein [Blastocatellia bacterium]